MFQNRSVSGKSVESADFKHATALLKRHEKYPQSTQCRSELISFLYSYRCLDADCAAMLFRIYVDERTSKSFAELATLGLDSLQLAQRQTNVRAEIQIVYNIAQFITDQHSGQRGLDIFTVVYKKLTDAMDSERRYDMLCLCALSARLAGEETNDRTFEVIEIAANKKALAIANNCFVSNKFVAARLLVLLIGDNIGSNCSFERKVEIDKIVTDLQPMKILQWIESSGTDDTEVADTLCYIALCMIHGYVKDVSLDQTMEIYRRAQKAGASDEILALWL